MKNQTIYSIQALRGIAALLICTIHLLISKFGLSDSIHPFTTQLGRFFISIGGWGVDLFFVISGFIITILISKINERSFKNAFAFLIKRFFRIYPLFWIALIVDTYFNFLIGYQGIFFQEVKSLQVIFLLTTVIPFLNQAWTLSFEVFFYGGVFLFLCSLDKKYFPHFLLCWSGFLLFFLILHSKNMLGTDYFPFRHTRVLEFFIGGLLFYILKKSQSNLYDKYISVFLGCLVIATGSIISYINFPNKHFYLGYWEILYLNGFGSAFLIYGLVGLEYHKKIYIPTLLKKLGDISFSIYLWHFPVITFSRFIDLKLSFYQKTPVLFHSFIEMIITLIVAYISYFIMERPCVNFSRWLTKKIL